MGKENNLLNSNNGRINWRDLVTPLKKKIPFKTFEMFLFRKFLFYKSIIKAEISIIIF